MTNVLEAMVDAAILQSLNKNLEFVDELVDTAAEKTVRARLLPNQLYYQLVTSFLDTGSTREFLAKTLAASIVMQAQPKIMKLAEERGVIQPE